MIQISPLINQEVASPETKTIPADKRGVFSKLLEGLLRNFKTDPQGSGQNPEPEGELTLAEDFPQAEGKSGSLKKTGTRGIKPAGVFRGEEKVRGKPSPEGAAEEALFDGEPRKIPPEGTEAGREAPVSLLVPQNRSEESLSSQKTVPEDSPQPDSRNLEGIFPLTKEPMLSEETGGPARSGETGRPELQRLITPAEVQRENPPRDRKTGEAGNGRDLGELSRRLAAEAEGTRLVRLSPEKPLEETGKTDRAGSRRAEGGGRDKRRERGALEVRDLRTAPAPEAPAYRGPSLAGEASASIREVELRVDLPGSGRNSGEGFSAGGNPPGQAFEESLAGELRGGLGDDIVRQASIILKDGGAGLIRLSLKPESLGNVKIRLEMAENKIAGRIIVESNEALRAFEREIASLEQAFKDSGFNGASIEMSVSADTGGGRENGRGKGEEASPFFSERLRPAVSAYESTGDFPVFGGNPGDAPAQRPVNMLV